MQNDPRTFAIIGAAMEVHRQLGCGFLEPVYQEALALELAARAVPCRREVELPIFYKGRHLKATYRADFRLLRIDRRRTESSGPPERHRRGSALELLESFWTRDWLAVELWRTVTRLQTLHMESTGFADYADEGSGVRLSQETGPAWVAPVPTSDIKSLSGHSTASLRPGHPSRRQHRIPVWPCNRGPDEDLKCCVRK